MFEELSPDREKAIKVYTALSVLFFVVIIGAGFVLAADRGYGAGPWDTDTVHSCYTPGGPHYVPDKPVSEQPCPSPTSAGLVARQKD
ncbi:hypothetical protein [Conexibacter sp. SYSU D00693]|uniref:hypothetical protein n=1 Tax=Conexibacter sp. SYSU D00693 TaxID=2812560 RepID=UPI00196B0177|nr:hypothetical protein [Conexibacter sp. SYSU D00693]